MDNAPSNAPWKPDSWQARKAVQLPVYRDAAALASTIAELGRLPPLVTSWEIEALKARLAQAQQGRAFVLQGGDCAETFADCSSENIVQKLKILLQMSMVIVAGLKRPVVRVGRIAGQYAKPRSDDLETRDGLALPSYRGDLVNRSAFTATDREPDPALMLRGYEYAALTLNFVRGLIDGGFADIHHPENWNLAFVSQSPMADRYHQVMRRVTDGLAFFEAVTGTRVDDARRIDFFASHEGLNLYYEQAQTRWLRHRSRWYDLTTHYPWIGARTAAVDGAHVEYFRGIANPIGVKIGPATTTDDLLRLAAVLNPANEPGRLTFIHRLGAQRIASVLPGMIEAVRRAGATVLWVCDPMHGNTELLGSGYKTRRFDRILDELEAAFRIHGELGTHLGGVHLELTGDHVTECIGGARGLTEQDLHRAYRTQVDPRLNYEQALEVAMRIADRG
ncbi:MAG: phospho-2-dehydro-3-deoxyheptonate aldolase [Gammaproteobacteria bacterium]|nr:MAG: 3-deoxy-7-phosphoheptulonate synthase class II [Pseudomonadota bacterium]MBC6943915.1 3-deoxy-7-phosphoheptulonate synthase class II [Gammaproteobacteria bacterium]MCE7895281.1 3-deoxy-7-phosphoheptulonate synthase class II [Gammaproteobacteria bacterium PRO8]MDL1880233.1 3-deoxy-7-phosphoheptulonate synthase class II [Gammaproteobacteria bacterium PRO2]MCL4776145.1 3-deoxy-7-phosphoheptulonate synthase class II [Gammaproteobacteria bacterium]